MSGKGIAYLQKKIIQVMLILTLKLTKGLTAAFYRLKEVANKGKRMGSTELDNNIDITSGRIFRNNAIFFKPRLNRQFTK